MASAAQAQWIWFCTLAGRVAASIPSTCAMPCMLFVPPRAQRKLPRTWFEMCACNRSLGQLYHMVSGTIRCHVALWYSDSTHWYDVDIAELSIHDWVGATWPNDWWHLATFGRSSSKWHSSHDIDSDSPFGSACSMHATSSRRILMMIGWMALGLPRFFSLGCDTDLARPMFCIDSFFQNKSMAFPVQWCVAFLPLCFGMISWWQEACVCHQWLQRTSPNVATVEKRVCASVHSASVGAVGAAAVCVAGVALGDVHLRFAWQAWHLVTWMRTLRGRLGTYGTGLALVARLGPSWHRCRGGCLRGRRGTWRHPPSLCVAERHRGVGEFRILKQHKGKKLWRGQRGETYIWNQMDAGSRKAHWGKRKLDIRTRWAQ